MYKYTTPTHTFKFTEDTDNFDKIIVTYSQRGETILEKTKTDMTFTESGTYYLASYALTQAESALFDENYPCFIQVKVKDSDGVIRVSPMEVIDVHSVLNQEVI